MSEESHVVTAVRKAEEGSLLHDLTQKIAYGLHEKNRNEEQNAHWFKAQHYLENYVTSSVP